MVCIVSFDALLEQFGSPFGGEFDSSVIIALVTLNSDISQSGAPLDVSITATGHAHIDVAWLWTLDQTRQKAAHTFHTVLRLMEQFPEYHFTQSQPQLYEFIRKITRCSLSR